MGIKRSIAKRCETFEGRKELTKSLYKEIEKAAWVLKKKYQYDATIVAYMDDIKQSFSLYLMEHLSIWKRALSFDSISAFIRTELDYFIGEQSENVKRGSYRTLARWTRDALRSDISFSHREIRGSRQRRLLLFGLKVWETDRPDFKEIHASFQELEGKVERYDVSLSFNPLIHTKSDFNALVRDGVYTKTVDTQIQECSTVLISVAGAWCRVAELIFGFRMFWLGFERADELVSDDIAVVSAEFDALLYDEAAEEMQKFLAQSQPVEISILQTILLKQSGHKVRLQDSAQKHGMTPSSVTEKKKHLFDRLKRVLSSYDEEFKQVLITTLIDLLDGSMEENNENI